MDEKVELRDGLDLDACYCLMRVELKSESQQLLNTFDDHSSNERTVDPLVAQLKQVRERV